MQFASDYRAYARASLKNRWLFAVGVSFLAALLGASTTDGYSSISFNIDSNDYNNILSDEALSIILPIIIAVGSFILIISIVQFIIGAAVQIGYNRVCLNIADQKESSVNQLFSGFNILGKALLLRVVTLIFIFLWTLLLIIPGIIASYRYSQAFFIMAENPDIGVMEAIDRSKEMMNGNKWNLFCLQISFIGWALLCLLTLGIGYLWLNPYMNVSQAAFYREISGTWHWNNNNYNNNYYNNNDYNNNNYNNNNYNNYYQ